MRSLLFSALALALCAPTSAQPGAPDPFFGGDGTGGTLTLALGDENEAVAVALADDGRVYLGGSRGDDAVVVRLFSDGPVNTPFGTGGTARLPVSGQAPRVTALHVYPDLSVLAAFEFGQGQSFPNRAGLVRLDANGQPDASFGAGGRVDVDPALYRISSGINTLRVFDDGSIQTVLSAFSEAQGGTGVLGIRWNADGTLDSGYGAGGFAFTINSDGSPVGTDGAVFDDGAAILVGSRNEAGYVVRLTPAGTFDTSFGTDADTPGVTTVPIPTPAVLNRFQGVTVDAQGRLVIAGANEGFISNALYVVRLLASGALDATFGTDGVVFPTLGTNENGAYDVAVQDDGRILVAAKLYSGSTRSLGVLRLTDAGALDPSFGAGGVATAPFGVNAGAEALALRPTGQVLVAGSVQSQTPAVGVPQPRGIAVAQFLTRGGTSAEDAAPRGVALSVWPNPARLRASVRLALDAPAEARVVLLDALGRHVARLHDGPLAAGDHVFALGAGLAPGVYVLRADLGGRSQTRRLSVVR